MIMNTPSAIVNTQTAKPVTMFRMRGIWSYYCYDPVTNKRYSRSCSTRSIKEARAVIAKRLKDGRLHFPKGYRPKNGALKSRYDKRTFGELTADYFIPDKCPIESDLRKRGRKVAKGDVLMTVYSDSEDKLEDALETAAELEPFDIDGMLLDRVRPGSLRWDRPLRRGIELFKYSIHLARFIQLGE